MATQARRAAHGAADTADSDGGSGLLGAAGSLAEIQREQLAAAAQAWSTLFRAGEALQQAQLHMGQRAALLHQQAADNLRKAATPIELVTIQSTLLLYQWQEAARYWQELLGAGAKAGGEMLKPPAGTQDTAGSGAAPASVMGAAMAAAAPMADAFQQMFTAPMKAAAAH